uniref:Uncharacterized protein n=1 Tax=Cucumis melo TaxID=3656 RepID=A0A9I9CXZ4_CUCME
MKATGTRRGGLLVQTSAVVPLEARITQMKGNTAYLSLRVASSLINSSTFLLRTLEFLSRMKLSSQHKNTQVEGIAQPIQDINEQGSKNDRRSKEFVKEKSINEMKKSFAYYNQWKASLTN